MANTIEKMVIGELGIDNDAVIIKTGETGSMTAKSPETDAEAGFLTVEIAGVEYEVPLYAKA